MLGYSNLPAPVKNQVAGLLFSPLLENVVLVRKDKPAWMAGLWNGVGGSEEAFDPSLCHAMSREFEEETGLLVPETKWFQYATLDTNGIKVHWFTAKDYKWASVKTNEREQIGTFCRETLITESIPLMPNLLWLYEMARAVHAGKDRCNQHYIKEMGYEIRE